MQKINFIGAGRVGKTLAKIISTKKIATIGGVVNSNLANAKKATEFIGSGIALDNIADLPPADIYFITVKDDRIQEITQLLADKNLFQENAIVAHCSGSLSSDILKAAKKFNCRLASIHPIKSFADPGKCLKQFPGTYCAIEGDLQAIDNIEIIFRAMGGIVFPIKKEQKTFYHLACTIANNYLVTLNQLSCDLYHQAGVDEAIAKKISSMLMNDALHHLNDLDHANALTGPIQRGDLQTIQNHLQVIQDPLLKNIYRQLGFATIALTNHVEEKKIAIELLLKE